MGADTSVRVLGTATKAMRVLGDKLAYDKPSSSWRPIKSLEVFILRLCPERDLIFFNQTFDSSQTNILFLENKGTKVPQFE